MSDAVKRRMDRAADEIAACREGRTTGPLSVAAFLELEDGKAERSILEQLQAPSWPAWPPEADGYHHAWVREHWSLEAAEEWDFVGIALGELHYQKADVLAWELAGGASLGDAFAAADLEPPPSDFSGSAREYVAASLPGLLSRFDSCAKAAQHGHDKWPPSEPPRMREGNRARLAEAQRRFRDPTDEERARILQHRGIGIRGEGWDWRGGIVYYQDLAKAAQGLASP